MSLNGISSYGYSNPYAVNNAYSQASFQGATVPMYTAEETPTEEKKSNNTAKIVLGVGAAAAAIGTTIYAFRKGKASNLAKGVTDASVWKNLGEGFKGIKSSVVNGFNKIFKKAKDTAPPTTAPTINDIPVQQNATLGEVYEKLGITQTLKEFRDLGKGG